MVYTVGISNNLPGAYQWNSTRILHTVFYRNTYGIHSSGLQYLYTGYTQVYI